MYLRLFSLGQQRYRAKKKKQRKKNIAWPRNAMGDEGYHQDRVSLKRQPSHGAAEEEEEEENKAIHRRAGAKDTCYNTIPLCIMLQIK